MTRIKKDDVLKVRLPSELKAAVMEAAKDKRGGLSQIIRELLSAWLAKQKKKSGQ